MTKKRQRRSAQFKFQVALKALKEQKTLSQLASETRSIPRKLRSGRSTCSRMVTACSASKGVREQHEQTVHEDKLFEQIGRLQMELEWLKKS